MTIIGLDYNNPDHLTYSFYGKTAWDEWKDEDLYPPIRCVCGGLLRYIGSAWEIYKTPGSTNIYRCKCGIELQS